MVELGVIFGRAKHEILNSKAVFIFQATGELSVCTKWAGWMQTHVFRDLVCQYNKVIIQTICAQKEQDNFNFNIYQRTVKSW